MFLTLRRVSASLVVLGSLCAVASASTYVVDANAGPGYDFTDVAPAIAVAHPGDVLLVRPGAYHEFTVTSGITILAQSGAFLSGPSPMFHVTSIPSEQRVVVSGLRVPEIVYPSATPSVTVQACAGHVLLDSLIGGAPLIEVDGSADVRLRNCQNVRVIADSSRVEITGSILRGWNGADGCGPLCGGPDPVGQPAYTGLVCRNGADVHVGASSIFGGDGGDGDSLSFCPNFHGGDGGDAIQVMGANLLITGSGFESIGGGAGGSGTNNGLCPPAGDGAQGAAIRMQGGTVLYSGVSIHTGLIFGPATLVVPADPCLLVQGSGALGTQVTFTVVGQPGDEARLRIGRSMVVQHLPFVFEDRLTVPLRSYQLGLLPPSGQASFTLTIPATLPLGTVLIGQGSTSNPTETRLTQSAPIAIH